MDFRLDIDCMVNQKYFRGHSLPDLLFTKFCLRGGAWAIAPINYKNEKCLHWPPVLSKISKLDWQEKSGEIGRKNWEPDFLPKQNGSILVAKVDLSFLTRKPNGL